MGIVIVLLPRSWKVSTKMALRNIGRQRTRTTTTLLALFIGVFTVGLVLSLGTGPASADQRRIYAESALQCHRHHEWHGYDDTTKDNLALFLVSQRSRADTLHKRVPVAINGQPVAQQLPNGSDRQTAIGSAEYVEGYNLSQRMPVIDDFAGAQPECQRCWNQQRADQ